MSTFLVSIFILWHVYIQKFVSSVIKRSLSKLVQRIKKIVYSANENFVS